MPRLILVICSLVIIYLFPGCKKSDNSNLDNSDSIIGTWELRVSYNGQGGRTTYPPGNGFIYNFQLTTYHIYSCLLPIKNGTYKIVKDSSYLYGLSDRIIYDNEYNAITVLEQVSGNKLMLRVDGYDAPSAEYTRIHL